jgi:glycosyltransferase involved in cell wall biosynthesis
MATMKLEHMYSSGVFNKKIVIIGISPPPLGGIAVHITRVRAKFLAQKNAVAMVDVIKQSKNRSKLGYFTYLASLIKKIRPDIIYYHTLSLRSMPIELGLLILLNALCKSQLVLIDHTPRFFYGKSWTYKKMVSFLLHYIDKQILIGDSTHRAYLENNIHVNANFSIESPYLPPDFTLAHEIFEKYPLGLKNFMARCSPIILINGSAIRLVNGVDLYGFDMAIELLKNMRGSYVGLVIVLAEIGDQEYFDKIYAEIKDNKNIYLLLGCTQEIWPLFSKIDLFIRPTCSDAYGISIQEALDMGVRVIASDVCQRPEGTILFESRNQDDLNKKAEACLF